jgi:hypothetical protein
VFTPGHADFGRVYFQDNANKKTSPLPPPPPPAGTGVKLERQKIYQTVLKDVISSCHKHSKKGRELANCEMARGHTDFKKQTEIETNMLEDAEIVFVTLGGAGSASIQNTRKFEVVVVDEAAQATEAAALSALHLGSSHVVLCGDPHQLPATVYSPKAKQVRGVGGWEGGRVGGWEGGRVEGGWGGGRRKTLRSSERRKMLRSSERRKTLRSSARAQENAALERAQENVALELTQPLTSRRSASTGACSSAWRRAGTTCTCSPRSTACTARSPPFRVRRSTTTRFIMGATWTSGPGARAS